MAKSFLGNSEILPRLLSITPCMSAPPNPWVCQDFPAFRVGVPGKGTMDESRPCYLETPSLSSPSKWKQHGGEGFKRWLLLWGLSSKKWFQESSFYSRAFLTNSSGEFWYNFARTIDSWPRRGWFLFPKLFMSNVYLPNAVSSFLLNFILPGP